MNTKKFTSGIIIFLVLVIAVDPDDAFAYVRNDDEGLHLRQYDDQFWQLYEKLDDCDDCESPSLVSFIKNNTFVNYGITINNQPISGEFQVWPPTIKSYLNKMNFDEIYYSRILKNDNSEDSSSTEFISFSPITINVEENVIVTATIYENRGVEHIDKINLLIGLDTKVIGGIPIQSSKISILWDKNSDEFSYDTDGYEVIINDVKIVEIPYNISKCIKMGHAFLPYHPGIHHDLTPIMVSDDGLLSSILCQEDEYNIKQIAFIFKFVKDIGINDVAIQLIDEHRNSSKIQFINAIHVVPFSKNSNEDILFSLENNNSKINQKNRLESIPNVCIVKPNNSDLSNKQVDTLFKVATHSIVNWKNALQQYDQKNKEKWKIDYDIINDYAKLNSSECNIQIIFQNIPDLDVSLYGNHISSSNLQSSLIVVNYWENNDGCYGGFYKKSTVECKNFILKSENELQVIISHELGHALGLGHHPYDDDDTAMGRNNSVISIMNENINNFPQMKITLEDVKQLHSIYDSDGFYSPLNLSSIATEQKIPIWSKHTAEWWSDNLIQNDAFAIHLQYLIDNQIILLENSSLIDFENSEKILEIKNTAYWWSQGFISDDEFFSYITKK